jgi:hypothetical protein
MSNLTATVNCAIGQGVDVVSKTQKPLAENSDTGKKAEFADVLPCRVALTGHHAANRFALIDASRFFPCNFPAVARTLSHV